jgi:superfamily II DNA or RNA helicase
LTTKGKKIELRDYQVDAILQSLRYYRNLLISPTSSGKSAILYFKIRYHIDVLNQNVTLIVPTTQLVSQMYSDFKDYSEENGWDVDENAQLLFSGKEKLFTKRLMISTWQSLAAMAKFSSDKFQHLIENTDVLCCDEAHQFSSTTTLTTAQKFVQAKWRTGTTGTLDDGKKIGKLNLIGLFSEPYQVITTKELMDQNSVVKLDINVCKLSYPNWLKEQMSGMDYRRELDWLVTYEPRNKFISSLAANTRGVTLVLYTYIEKHGAVLYKMI